MSAWPTRRLGEICDVNPRSNGAELLGPAARVSFVPMAAVDEVHGRVGRHETREAAGVAKGYSRFRERDVLFARITPCMENGKAAIARELAGGVGFGSTEFHVLRPHDGLLPEWLLAFVRRPAFRKAAALQFTGTAGQQRVPASFLKEVEIPVPPPAEQERLLSTLERAQELVELGEYADRQAARMYASVYHELFWSDRSSEEQWPTARIGELLAKKENAIRTGPFGSQLRHSEFGEEGVPVLGIENVVTNQFRWGARRCVSRERFERFRRFEVFGGDVLVTIMGTVGRCCVAPDDLPECMSTKHLCVITLDRDVVDPTFVWGALLFDARLRQQTLGVGGGAIMEGWNATIIKQLQLRVPPLELQREFARRTVEVRWIQGLQKARSDQTDALYEAVREQSIGGFL